MIDPWDYIKAEKFFPKYCPQIKNYKRKISGRSSKGKPIDFTESEKQQIKEAYARFIKDLLTDH